MPFAFSKAIVICTLSLGLKFSDCVQNYTAVRGLLAKSEPMGIWQRKTAGMWSGKDVES